MVSDIVAQLPPLPKRNSNTKQISKKEKVDSKMAENEKRMEKAELSRIVSKLPPLPKKKK